MADRGNGGTRRALMRAKCDPRAIHDALKHCMNSARLSSKHEEKIRQIFSLAGTSSVGTQLDCAHWSSDKARILHERVGTLKTKSPTYDVSMI